MKEYRLTIISGNSVGKAQILTSFPVTLGRSSKNDFSIPDEMLSRHHCSIDMRGDELWLTDLASANGTAVNGKIIGKRQASCVRYFKIANHGISRFPTNAAIKQLVGSIGQIFRFFSIFFQEHLQKQYVYND